VSSPGGDGRPAKSSSAGTIVIVAIILVFVIAAALFAWHGLTAPIAPATAGSTPSSTPSPTASPTDTSSESVDPNRILVSQAVPGVCFDQQAMSDSGGTYIWTIDCTQPHDSEVFYAAAMPEGDYPDATGWQDNVLQYCHPAFATYTGVTYGQNALQISYLYPPEDVWNNGDRTLVCYAIDPAGSRTSSIKAAS